LYEGEVCMQDEVGQVRVYYKIFLAKEDEDWVSVRSYIEGSSAKYMQYRNRYK